MLLWCGSRVRAHWHCVLVPVLVSVMAWHDARCAADWQRVWPAGLSETIRNAHNMMHEWGRLQNADGYG